MNIRTKRIIACVAFLLVIALIAVALFLFGEKFGATHNTGDSPSASDSMNSMERVFIDDVAYLPDKNVKNYLVIGIDDAELKLNHSAV